MDNKNKIFSFETEQNSVDLLYDDDDIMITSIDLFHVDEEGECNRNSCNISRSSAEKSLKTIFNKPIICRFNSTCKDFVTDVTEHARNDKELFLTQVAGHIPSDARVSFVKRDNNKTYCNVESIIQKRYMPELVEIIKRNDGSLKVSIEIKARGKTDDDGIFVIDSFVLQGVCLLGTNVLEGIEGSHMEVLKFSKKEIDTMNEKYLKFTKSKEIEKNIFEKIKDKKMQEKIISNSLSTEDMFRKLNKIIETYKYNDNGFNAYKYRVEEIYPEEKFIIVKDHEFETYWKISYSVLNDEISIDMDTLVEVSLHWDEKTSNTLYNSKSEIDNMVVNKVAESYRTIKIDEKEGNMENEKDLQNELDTKTEEVSNAAENAEQKTEDVENSENSEEKDVQNSATEEESTKESEEIKNTEDDDVDDSEKECWEEKYNELNMSYKSLEEKFKSMETDFASCKEELQSYKAKEEKEEMRKYLNTYKNCFSKEDLEVMAKKIEDTARVDFEKEVDDKVKEFVRKSFEKQEETSDEEEIKNSYGIMFNPETKVAKTGKKTLDDVIASF